MIKLQRAELMVPMVDLCDILDDAMLELGLERERERELVDGMAPVARVGREDRGREVERDMEEEDGLRDGRMIDGRLTRLTRGGRGCGELGATGCGWNCATTLAALGEGRGADAQPRFHPSPFALDDNLNLNLDDDDRQSSTFNRR